MEKFFVEFAQAISPALQTLLQALAAALVAQAIQYVRAKYLEAKAGMTTDQQYVLSLVVSSAVRAAEQAYKDNEAKKAYALMTAEKQLKAYGIILDLDIIAAEIEAQVFQLKSIEANG